ncbi:hypothetical protein ACFL03_08840 [Thermodesulfobacteriota bacterium]
MTYPFSSKWSLNIDDQEIESLNTDVMRFMAIIAFCLLVIFIPLIRALPPMPIKHEIRFASEGDLLALVRYEKISLYACPPGLVFRLQIDQSADIHFLNVQSPGVLHNLKPKTVPQKVRTAFKKELPKVQGFQKSGALIKYGVNWSKKIQNAIDEAKTKYKDVSGIIIIHKDESVSFVPRAKEDRYEKKS